MRNRGILTGEYTALAIFQNRVLFSITFLKLLAPHLQQPLQPPLPA